jgi:hypothetical protein
MTRLNYSLFGLLLFFSFLIALIEFKKKDYLFRYPFLAALVFVGWISPQIYGLLDKNLYSYIIWKTILFAILCLISIYLGFRIKSRKLNISDQCLNLNRLIWLNFIIFLIGAYFYHKVSLSAEVANLIFGGQWEGIITVYAFFSKLLSLSLGISLIVDTYKKSYLNKLVILFSSYFYLEWIILAGRREEMIEFFIMFSLYIWWKKGKILSRWSFIVLFFIAMIFINSIGTYRSLEVTASNKLEIFIQKLQMAAQVDWIRHFKDFLNNPSSEILNAVIIIDFTEKYFFFDFGLSLWNAFVHSYIPATFLGREFKESLKFKFPDTVFEVYGYTPYIGTTFTGLSDSFQSFWWFGFIKFFLISYLMKLWYFNSKDSIIGKVVITQLYSVSLLAITHTTHHFFLGFIKLFVFLMPIFSLSKFKKG